MSWAGQTSARAQVTQAQMVAFASCRIQGVTATLARLSALQGKKSLVSLRKFARSHLEVQ